MILNHTENEMDGSFSCPSSCFLLLGNPCRGIEVVRIESRHVNHGQEGTNKWTHFPPHKNPPCHVVVIVGGKNRMGWHSPSLENSLEKDIWTER